MVHVLVEERYTDNNRLSVIMGGISSVLKKKRMAIRMHKKLETLPASAHIVMVIYASLKWVTETIERLNERNIHPVLFGFYDVDTMYKYSGITFSFAKTMYRMTKYVLSKNKGKTAFLGYNDDSLPDKQKKLGVEAAVGESGEELAIFKNRGNIVDCIKDFLENGKDVKNIVCGNDSIAVILRSLYSEALEGRTICSCSGLKLSEYVENPYPTTYVDYYESGKRLAELYLFLDKNGIVSPTIMHMEMGICIGKEKLSLNGIPKNVPGYTGQIIDYYGDQSIQEVENLDCMLLNCDEMDLKILKGLISGLSYEQVAEMYYFSANTVKYRVHLMMKNGGNFASKRELLATIEKYGLKF